jgi:hypothetical protein
MSQEDAMTNFERLTMTLQSLFLEMKLGLSLPLQRMLALLTACLLEGTDAHLTDLAEALPDVDASQPAKEQRIRRFLSNKRLAPAKLLPLLIILLRPILAALPAIVLSMDRTHWKKRTRHVNVLMVSLVFEGRAIPLFWVVFDRAGNSSLVAWKTVLTPVITTLQAQPWLSSPIIVVADREFASPKLAEWLKTEYRVESTLRLKRSLYLNEGGHSIQLAHLLLYFPQGATRFYRHITVTNSNTFQVNVTITWGKQYDEPLIIVTTFDDAPSSLNTYQRRFGIEPMFKDHKSNGFNLEQTKVTKPKRIESLLIIIALAHVFCTSEGHRKEAQGETKPKKVKGEEIRAVGLFLVGLKAFQQFIRKTRPPRFKKFLRCLFTFMDQPLKL